VVVSMFQVIIEIPETSSIKDKRRVVKSLRDRTQRRFRLSCAEVDLQDSLRFSQLGGAIVSNSREFGESVLNKVIQFIDDSGLAKLHDFQLHSEFF
jgi:uncharacterized protein YlxP (DUF503 family)